eukprot:jgi/Mesvir1/16636/Mv10169-RA.1
MASTVLMPGNAVRATNSGGRQLVSFRGAGVGRATPSKSIAGSRRIHRLQVSARQGGYDAIMAEGIVSTFEKNPDLVTEVMKRLNPALRQSVANNLYPQLNDGAAAFAQADLNKDGVLSPEELQVFLDAKAAAENEPPSKRQLFDLGIKSIVGMVGFGFTDNFLMLLAGDALEATFGTFGITGLVAAGLGNAVSDVLGVGLAGYIEAVSKRFVPDPKMSLAQLESSSARLADSIGSAIGIGTGCMLGLAPFVVRQVAASRDASKARSDAHASKLTLASAPSREASHPALGPGSGADGRCFASASMATVASVGVPGLEAVPVASGMFSSRVGTVPLVVVMGAVVAIKRLARHFRGNVKS